jgi:hypothetical protein
MEERLVAAAEFRVPAGEEFLDEVLLHGRFGPEQRRVASEL